MSSFLGQLLLSRGLLDPSQRPSRSLSLLTWGLETTGSTSQNNYGIEGADIFVMPSMEVLSRSPISLHGLDLDGSSHVVGNQQKFIKKKKTFLQS